MRLECRSYAKVNWSLELLGLRADGYHEIRTILQTIDLHDVVVLERTAREIEIQCDDPAIPIDERNLVYQAAETCRARKGIRAGVRISIKKQIPVGGGLGGGSSNAAVTLIGLNRLWEVELHPRELVEMGASIGSDVPFFFCGGSALGAGRGTDVVPINEMTVPHLLLVTPGFGVPTGDAYREANRLLELTSPERTGNITDCCPAVLLAGQGHREPVDPSAWLRETRNDLEPGVTARYPEIGHIKDCLYRAGAWVARMSGSGSTVYGVFRSARTIATAHSVMAAKPWRVVRTGTVNRSRYWESLLKEV